MSLSARQRVVALFDGADFVEYGALARPALSDLAAPADGVITCAGTVRDSTVAAVSYDFSAMGGSQGHVGHLKVDRLLRLATEHRWPVVFCLEGGGARVQESTIGFGPPLTTFATLARLCGNVPTVAAVLGRAFAGHANLAGCCDFVVATKGSALGLGGPPLVEAAIGQRLTPEEIGPVEMHARAGSVDVVVDSEVEAIAVVRHYLDYFLGDSPPEPPEIDPSLLRALVPANPRDSYDVRTVIRGLVDSSVILELRAAFAPNLVTALARLEGRTIGLVANQPCVLAGALDATAAEKFTRFVRMCDAFGVPIVFLVDTPGFMVGPEAERSGVVRKSADALLALGQCSVPIVTVVLRKAYGFAKSIMGSGAFEPLAYLAWPHAEFGAMGLGGAAAIVHKEELATAADRRQRRDDLAAELRTNDTLVHRAERFNIDDVIAPEETRQVLARLLSMRR
jgi:acetyl-CoA carboxylase carboxyltransferase component